jgi:hypothetical protein
MKEAKRFVSRKVTSLFPQWVKVSNNGFDSEWYRMFNIHQKQEG